MPSATTRLSSKRICSGSRNCPEMSRLRSLSVWSMCAAATASLQLGFALGDQRMETVGKFLGDEAGRKPSFAPARMLHQRGQKRNVVADAVDDESVERGRLGVDRAEPVGRVGDELGDHRIVVDRDLPALIDAGVVADGDAVLASLRAADGISPGVRSKAGNRASDPRRRRGLRPPSRRASRRPG